MTTTNLFDSLQLFRGENFKVNEYITIHHPTLGEICDIGEEEYYSNISILVACPSQYKVQLFDMGIDYTALSDYNFFLMMYQHISEKVSRLLFCDTVLSDFQMAAKEDNKAIILYNPESGAILDELGYTILTEFLRAIHGFKKIVEKPGNEKARKYLIERDRSRLSRKQNEPFESALKPLISAMVNCEHFKYDHITVWNMPIYTFTDSVCQIKKIKNYDSLMFGIYSGNIDTNKIDQKELSWIDFSKN